LGVSRALTQLESSFLAGEPQGNKEALQYSGSSSETMTSVDNPIRHLEHISSPTRTVDRDVLDLAVRMLKPHRKNHSIVKVCLTCTPEKADKR
jgi:hypothetical protein